MKDYFYSGENEEKVGNRNIEKKRNWKQKAGKTEEEV